MVIAGVRSCLGARTVLRPWPVPEHSSTGLRVPGPAAAVACVKKAECVVQRGVAAYCTRLAPAATNLRESGRTYGQEAMSNTNLSRQPSQVSVTGSGSSNSRIEVSTVQVNENEQGGNLTIYGGAPCNIRTTISSEGTNYQIADQAGQVRNINLPNTRPPSGFQGKYEKRVIIENGVETVEEYQNDRLVSRTVNGVPQQVS
ncbi:uncharacterized protein LOC142575720 [Dermacentor variabilis]|uniref:uncharacterized protein LOC142575720 n=1 Tax=Dermacentor variabilis TaxID=34621 RepID=UPI003F5C40E4